VEFGKGVVLKDCNSDVTVMTAGPLLEEVAKACDDLNVNLVYFHTIKPIDKDVILKFKDTRILVVNDAFGLYEAICEVPDLSVSYHGIPDMFCGWYGTLHDIRKKLKLDHDSLKEVVMQHREKQ
jgi:transketolase